MHYTLALWPHKPEIRGAYVRWAVNIAWTVFETACEDALCITGLGNRFKETLDQAISAASLPPLDWSRGLWQKVLNIYRLRKEYVHVALPQNRLFAEIAEANHADDLLERAGIKDFRFHDLRHTFASWYMMNGGDLYELAKILGHSNIKMTERYAKLARQHIARTSGTARELWKILEPQCANAANVG